MEYDVLGDGEHHVRISRLVHGCEPLGGMDWGRIDRRSVREAVARALDLGVTAFDTADVYGLGESERALGSVLGRRARDLAIITKGGVNWRMRDGRRAETFADLSRAHVTAAVDASLRRLGIDCIPLYFMHRPDPSIPIDETLEALARCREAGKIRLVGASNFPGALLREVHRRLPLSAVQLQYNLVDRTAEQDILPTCRALGVPVIAYGGLAQGLLGGRYGRDARFTADDRRHRLPHFSTAARDTSFATMRRAKVVGASLGRTTAQVSIRWVLEQVGVAGVIVGAKSPSQVRENVRVFGWRLGLSRTQELASWDGSDEQALAI